MRHVGCWQRHPPTVRKACKSVDFELIFGFCSLKNWPVHSLMCVRAQARGVHRCSDNGEGKERNLIPLIIAIAACSV